MNRGPRIAVILGIIVVLALLAFGVYRVLRPAGGGTTPGRATPTPQLTLLDYIERDTQVRYTIEGPVTANENHTSIRITVTKDNRMLEIFNTYEGGVSTSQTFSNNAAAFNDFMHALNDAGFISRRPKSTDDDEKGACPTGQRYILELLDGSTQASRLWNGTCGEGNFGGNSSLVRQLFQAQIPDYSKRTSNVRMSM
jgi:hypothetical protein